MYLLLEIHWWRGAPHTPTYEQEIGLREGSVLSPAQFILFINGLAEKIQALGLGVSNVGIWLGLLLYADDIVILAFC